MFLTFNDNFFNKMAFRYIKNAPYNPFKVSNSHLCLCSVASCLQEARCYGCFCFVLQCWFCHLNWEWIASHSQKSWQISHHAPQGEMKRIKRRKIPKKKKNSEREQKVWEREKGRPLFWRSSSPKSHWALFLRDVPVFLATETTSHTSESLNSSHFILPLWGVTKLNAPATSDNAKMNFKTFLFKGPFSRLSLIKLWLHNWHWNQSDPS